MSGMTVNRNNTGFTFDCSALSTNEMKTKEEMNLKEEDCEFEKNKKTFAQMNFEDICNKERLMNPESVIVGDDFCDESRFKWNECFVFMIFPKSRAQAYRNAAVKEKAILSRYSIYKPGMNVGFAYQVQVIEGNWSPSSSIGVFKFATYKDAKMWLESDNEFRQQDFLTHVDIWIVPINNADLTRKDRNGT